MSNIKTKLQFSRCREVLPSRSAAVLHLRERTFARGEPVIVNYFENPGDTSSINTLVAVGMKNGKGKDCFRIVTLGQYEIVWGVSSSLPDVSLLVHDEVYLYEDENGAWWYVSAPDKHTRSIQPIPRGNHIFLNLADNLIYTADQDRYVRSITDTYTKNEIDSLIATIAGGDFSGLGNLERRLSEAYESIQEVIAINDHLAAQIQEMAEAAEYVTGFADRIEDIEDKVGALEFDPNTSTVSSTFSGITLSEGENDESPIVINKTTVITTENIGDVVEPIPAATLNAELT